MIYVGMGEDVTMRRIYFLKSEQEVALISNILEQYSTAKKTHINIACMLNILTHFWYI